MGALFVMELLRFSRLAVGAFFVHLAVQYYLYYLGSPFIIWPVSWLWLIFSCVLAAGFGILQILLHRRPNDWLYLLQRPLSHKRLFVSLVSAGTVILCIVLVVPPLVLLAIIHGSGLMVIEARHYLMLLYLLGPALSMYYCACFAMLSPNRLAILALALPTVLIMADMGSNLLLNSLLILALSFSMALITFKPDPKQAASTIPVLLTEIPIQYGALWGLVMAIMLCHEFTWMLTSNPQSNPPPGTDRYVLQLSGQERLHYGLAQSEHPDASFLDQQVVLGEASSVRRPSITPNPSRFELPFRENTLVLEDSEHGIRWQFRHKEMLFQGRDRNTGEVIGWLGPDGFSHEAKPAVVFKTVPWVSDKRFILDAANLWLVDLERQVVHHRFAGRADDPFSDSLNPGKNFTTLLSQQRMYLFNTADLNNANIKLHADAVLDLPVKGDPDRHFYSVLELINGYLVAALINTSPTTIAPDFALFGNSALLIYQVGHDEPQSLISRVPLDTGLNPFFIYGSLVLSPGMRLLTDLYWGIRLDKSLDRTLPLPFINFPTGIVFLTLATSLICGVVTWLLVRRSSLPLPAKGFWVLFNILAGATGLLVFLLGHYWGKTGPLKPLADKP